MSVKLSTRQVGDVTVIDSAGRITLGEGASVFRDTVRDLAAKGDKKILLNLSDVTYIDSSGIGELVSGFTTVTNHGGVLKRQRPVADYQAVHGIRGLRRRGDGGEKLLGYCPP